EGRHRAPPWFVHSVRKRGVVPSGGLEARGAIDRDVAMGFLADEGDGHTAATPQPEIESETGEHRDHHIDDLGRQAAKLEDGDRLAVHRNPKTSATYLGLGMDREAEEHKLIARGAR